MRERGILFRGSMVEAILAGRKTQTRRPVKLRHETLLVMSTYERQNDKVPVSACPYGVVGDRLWVRETFALDESLDQIAPSDVQEGSAVWYQPGTVGAFLRTGRRKCVSPDDVGRTRPGIHMPRWASRLTLEITAVRAERLEEITDADARAEGIDGKSMAKFEIVQHEIDRMPRASFAVLWNKIHGDGSWAANPLVWVVSFRRVDGV